MTDDERRVLAEARTECIVAVAYLQGANDRNQALEMMRKVLDRLNTAFDIEYEPAPAAAQPAAAPQAAAAPGSPAPRLKPDTGAARLL